MLSKHLLVAWAFFDLCLMGAGILSFVLSFVWQEDNLLRNLTYSTFDLNSKCSISCNYSPLMPRQFSVGRILGIVLLATSLLSVFLIILRGKRPLVIVNWLLLLDAVAILSVATFIWMYTLHERINYHAVFGRQSNATKIKVQDVVRYFGRGPTTFTQTLSRQPTVAMLWLF